MARRGRDQTFSGQEVLSDFESRIAALEAVVFGSRETEDTNDAGKEQHPLISQQSKLMNPEARTIDKILPGLRKQGIKI